MDNSSLGFSPINVGSEQEWVVCWNILEILGLLFLGSFLFACLKLFSMWLDGSKLSNRKHTMIRLALFAGARFLWYYLHSMPRFTRYVPLMDWIEYVFGEYTSMLMLLLYYWPICDLLSAQCYLYKNWLKLYHIEKLRAKMAPRFVGRTEPTPVQRKKKATLRLNQFGRIHVVATSICTGLLLVLTPFYCDQIPDFLAEGTAVHRTLSRLSMVWPDVLLPAVAFVCSAVVGIITVRFLANLRRALAAESDKLKHLTELTLVLSLGFLFYFAVNVALFLPLELSSSANPIVDLKAATLISRIIEMCLTALVLSLLSSPFLSLKAPFPTRATEITSDWLTKVLRENGTIKQTTTVVGFSLRTLRGGVHFKVSRVSLVYSHEKPDDPHKTVVVKLLCWDKPVIERMIIFMKMWWGSRDKDAAYLKSYKIESEFYKYNGDDVPGFRIPSVYYNLEDCFNQKFGMVLQDISMLPDGQPDGFVFEQAQAALVQLARFHAAKWGTQPKEVTSNIWRVAGYWTDDKRIEVKRRVKDLWNNTLANFPKTSWSTQHAQLGEALQQLLPWLEAECAAMHAAPYTTLCHGDFKISNLFITPPHSIPPGEQHEQSEEVLYVIDYQWFGFGNCCLDVAYFLMTSLQSDVLPHIPSLYRVYYDALVKGGVKNYPWETFMHHAKVVELDFAVYCIASKWAAMGPLDVKDYAEKQKDGLHLRSMHHINHIVDSTAVTLREMQKKEKTMKTG